jgi:cytochrome c oxidase subunit IV
MERRHILVGAFRTWAMLLMLGMANLVYAVWQGTPLKPVVALVIVGLQASLVLGSFMQIGRASRSVRVTALAGIVWLSFLFLMSFADLWTR